MLTLLLHVTVQSRKCYTEKITNSTQVIHRDRAGFHTWAVQRPCARPLGYTTSQSNLMKKIKKESECWPLTSPFLSKYRKNQHRLITRGRARWWGAWDLVSGSRASKAVLGTQPPEKPSSPAPAASWTPTQILLEFRVSHGLLM